MAIQLDCEESNALANIIIQPSPDPGAVLFMRFNQPASYRAEGLFGHFSFCHVQTRPDVSREGAVRVESGHARVIYPTIFSVMPPQPVLHCEGFTRIKSLDINGGTSLAIFLVDALQPTVPQLHFE